MKSFIDGIQKHPFHVLFFGAGSLHEDKEDNCRDPVVMITESSAAVISTARRFFGTYEGED